MKTNIRALIVEDERLWQDTLSELLKDAGLLVDIAPNFDEAERLLHATSYRIALVDLSLEENDHDNKDGLKVLKKIRDINPGCIAVMLTGHATVELAVNAIKDYGAFTLLRKGASRRRDIQKIINEALAAAPAFPGEARETISSTGSISKIPNVKTAPVLGHALLVEDDAGWRGLLSELLQDSGYEVHTSSSYVEALGLLARTLIQIAIVDLSLANSLDPEYNLDGYKLFSSTKEAQIPTIIVSGHADLPRIEKAYEEQNIFACMEKQKFDRRSFLQIVKDAGRHSETSAVLDSLTAREREVLDLLVQGMANKEIAVALVVTPNTVKRHLKSVFKKLDVHSRAAAVAKVVGGKVN